MLVGRLTVGRAPMRLMGGQATALRSGSGAIVHIG